MAWKRKPQCPVPGCTELKKVNASQGTLYGYCQKHMSKAARERDRRAHAERQIVSVPPPVPEVDTHRFLVVNLNTSRAQAYEAQLVSPVRAVVPHTPEAYATFIRAAQEAGYIVVLEA